MYIYMNGHIVSAEEASISPFDHGFMYGLGLFETLRVYEGHPFLLDDHLLRINTDLQALRINAYLQREEIIGALQQLLQKNELNNAYIRLNVSAGVGEIGLQTASYDQPNIIIFAKPLEVAREMIEKTAVTLSLRRNTPESVHRMKSHHFMNNVLGKREIGDNSQVEGIFLTEHGHVAEGITSNLFWVKDGCLFTPALETGILNGITRQFIIVQAKKNGLFVQEGLYTLEEAKRADEWFVTNSIQEIVPISAVDDVKLCGVNGEIVQLLHHQYSQYRALLWTRNNV